MSYSVVEIFATLQGEGANAGMPAIFCRFSGCNLWTGNNEHRARDALRHEAACPKWCDTDFRKGTRFETEALVEAIFDAMRAEAADVPFPLIVFTGGEPMLQLDEQLLVEIRRVFRARYGATPHRMHAPDLAVETNGTVEPGPGVRERLTHICVSPKTAPDTIKVRSGTELKIIYPSCNPNDYKELAQHFTHWWISPQARPGDNPGVSYLDAEATRQAAAWCVANPEWRLSLQSHKIVGLR